MRSREQVVVEHQKVRVLAHFDGAFGGFNAELFGAVDGITKNHFLNAHSLTLGRECRNGPAVFVEPCLLIDPACHSDFHGKIGTPVPKIAVENLIAGPGHECAAVPHRLAAEHGMGAFLSNESGPVFDRVAAYVAAVPPRCEISRYAKLCKTV